MILPFTGKRVRHIEVIDGFNTHPPVPEQVSVPVVQDVQATCAIDVVQALQFYAAGGNDQGDAARRALRGMSSVLNAANS